MSKRSEQTVRLELYRELNDIVSAMKNMAQVELHRVARIEKLQAEVVTTTLTALAHLRHHHPGLFVQQQGRAVLIVLGSERGFCGGFNEQIVRAFAANTEQYDALLIVGSRLAGKLQDVAEAAFFSGPAITDEVLPCEQQLIDHLTQHSLPARLTLLCHTQQGVAYTPLLPLPDLPEIVPSPSLHLHLAPAEVWIELQWQLLQQGLLGALLFSLRTENRMRLQQMEGAREHLEDLTRTLRLRLNTLRQQEIVEEIEALSNV